MVGIDWSDARKIVGDTFFHDTVNVYKREDAAENEWGEVVPGMLPVALNVACNVEVASQASSQAEAGMTQEKTLRISLPKDAFVPSMDEQYLIQIVTARIAIDTEGAWWHTETIQEGQISIVLNCKLGKTV